jgi:kynurenine 3-monooxygenase
LFFPFDGETSFKTINSEEKALEFFKTNFADFVPLIPNLEKEFFTNPTSSLMTVRCYPWRYQDKFLMVGDSAHGIVPFYGQGMNCGFEDCVVLDKMMEKYGEDWDTIFEEFQKSRKPDSDAIAQLALDNFVEMRDRVGKPSFLLQKKIENWFSEKHPDKWIPLYTMVTYSPHIRYSEAYREGQKQESIMQQVMNIPDIENKWNTPEVEEKIISLLEYFK